MNGFYEAIIEARDGLGITELDGECPYNAVRLYDELREREFEARVIRGELAGRDEYHWWVEFIHDGEWKCIDLAAEIEDWMGFYIGQRPTEYLPEQINPEGMEQFRTRP